jgi:hypothetical protein
MYGRSDGEIDANTNINAPYGLYTMYVYYTYTIIIKNI